MMESNVVSPDRNSAACTSQALGGPEVREAVLRALPTVCRTGKQQTVREVLCLNLIHGQ